MKMQEGEPGTRHANSATSHTVPKSKRSCFKISSSTHQVRDFFDSLAPPAIFLQQQQQQRYQQTIPTIAETGEAQRCVQHCPCRRPRPSSARSRLHRIHFRFPWMTCAAIRIPCFDVLHLRFLPPVVITHCKEPRGNPQCLCDLVLIYSLYQNPSPATLHASQPRVTAAAITCAAHACKHVALLLSL